MHYKLAEKLPPLILILRLRLREVPVLHKVDGPVDTRGKRLWQTTSSVTRINNKHREAAAAAVRSLVWGSGGPQQLQQPLTGETYFMFTNLNGSETGHLGQKQGLAFLSSPGVQVCSVVVSWLFSVGENRAGLPRTDKQAPH